MRFLCVNCSYIYDEALWDIAEGIEAGTSVDQIQEDILCPGCEGSFDEFAPIEDEVLYAESPENHNDTEREHIPYVLYQDHEKVEVSVGEEIHPISDDHRITGIYLIDEHGHIVEEVFIMPEEEPLAEFDVSGLDTFELRASCSKHGLWSTGLIQAKD